jgi:hypothetical protein
MSVVADHLFFSYIYAVLFSLFSVVNFFLSDKTFHQLIVDILHATCFCIV